MPKHRGISPVAGSASCRAGLSPGARANMGKLSTSVGASTPRISRLIWRMPASLVISTLTSQGISTASASRVHLLGYDHLDEGPEKARMRAREECIMKELGLEREGNT